MSMEITNPPLASQPGLTPRAAKAIAAAQLAARRAEPAVTEEALTRAVETRLAERVPGVGSGTSGRLMLAVDNETGRVIGRIVDRDSGKLIVQIPSEEMLALIAATKEMLGPLVDEVV